MLYFYYKQGHRKSVVSQVLCRMDVIRLEQCTSLKCGSPSRDSSVWKGIAPHSFHKLTVTFSRISPSQYGYFDVGTLFYESHPFCTTLDLQLSFYCPLCYNIRAHYPLLQYLRTTSAILPGAYSYFAVSSFKCDGKNSCHDLIWHMYYHRNRLLKNV